MTRVSAALAAIILVVGIAGLSVAQAVPPDESSAALGKSVAVADTSDDRLPADSFAAVDSVPEMIFQSPPNYPKDDLQAGSSGKVWVKALVNRQGVVRKAIVLKLEQGATDAMGKAAVEAALKNKFQPAKSKGKPVACWVTYAVSFVLKDSLPADSSSSKVGEKPAPKK